MAQYNKNRSSLGRIESDIQTSSSSDDGSDHPKPIASDFTGNGNGSPLLADAVIDGGLSGGLDGGSPERRNSRGIVVRNGGKGLAFSDWVVDGCGDLLPSGLISDTGDEALFRGAGNSAASNASGNLVVPGSGTDPLAAPLAGLI
jgi:hypothetical protein